MTMLQALKTTLIDTIYPPRCLACTEATDAAARPVPGLLARHPFHRRAGLRQVRRAADRRGGGGGRLRELHAAPAGLGPRARRRWSMRAPGGGWCWG